MSPIDPKTKPAVAGFLLGQCSPMGTFTIKSQNPPRQVFLISPTKISLTRGTHISFSNQILWKKEIWDMQRSRHEIGQPLPIL